MLRNYKHKYYTSERKLLYDFDEGIKKYKKNNSKFLSYKEFKKNNSLEEILSEHKELTDVYTSRIDKLHSGTTQMGATPIFINQLTAKGFDNSKLVALNSSLIIHCKKNNYKCIDVASKLDGQFDFWWDGIHTTPKGSREIANIIAPELIKILKDTNE